VVDMTSIVLLLYRYCYVVAVGLCILVFLIMHFCTEHVAWSSQTPGLDCILWLSWEYLDQAASMSSLALTVLMTRR